MNGENADPLYKYLKAEASIAEEDEASQGLYKLLEGKDFTTIVDDIKWNFTKFLVSKEGKEIARFICTNLPTKSIRKRN